MTPNAEAACQLLEWDTNFFGRRIGRLVATDATPVDMKAVQAWRRRHAVECLYCLVAPSDQHTWRTLEQHGFQLVDVRLTLARPAALPVDNPRPQDFILRPAETTDVSTLRMLAAESHQDTRFFHDPHFARERCRALYATWIEKSCLGWAEVVVVAELDKQVVGYCTGHLTPAGESNLGLVGVAAGVHRRGIGRALVGSCLQWLQTHGAGQITVITQAGNLAAYNLYRRAGFATAEWGHWYHGWFDDDRTQDSV